MIPLRFVSEALGADLKWDVNTFTATITSGRGTVTPEPNTKANSYRRNYYCK
ncbi:hypothetical protein D3P09_25475 [Paenibacillus pinisoli]|uniref:Copper amine oxidase-like N-terminal domain-containing protein n=1 Tax=Paenibacillus pinisoli TaxID=1276110 RepID=A0A3A6PA78_9BACL|nr:stalk domain-containing protein [Paenibacillus pinisoli]RJX36865.1 hypothetical protein D3P09_25475 [Paenibacillus pinisoli]